MNFYNPYFLIILNNFNIVFAAILCILPVFNSVTKSRTRILIGTVLVLTLHLFLTAFLCIRFDVNENLTLMVFVSIYFTLYLRICNISFFKALSVFLMVVSLFCFTRDFTFAFNAWFHPDGTANQTYLDGSIFSCFISLLFLLAAWIPSYRYVSWMINNINSNRIWKLMSFWAFVFISLLNFMVPHDFTVLHVDQSFSVNIIVLCTLLFIMLYVYYMLYQIAIIHQDILDLERQNQYLDFQSKQYLTLVDHMNKTKKLRHDFRHQLLVIAGMVRNQNYSELEKYLKEYMISAEDSYVPLCANPAVDAVASYFDKFAKEEDISVSWSFQIPQELPLPESDFCGMLGNLVENAMNACMAMPSGAREITVISRMPSNSMLILIVENTYNGTVHRKGDVWYSTHHSGEGIGIASVRETVERYNGNLDIHYDNALFTVNILLNF